MLSNFYTDILDKPFLTYGRDLPVFPIAVVHTTNEMALCVNKLNKLISAEVGKQMLKQDWSYVIDTWDFTELDQLHLEEWHWGVRVNQPVIYPSW